MEVPLHDHVKFVTQVSVRCLEMSVDGGANAFPLPLHRRGLSKLKNGKN